MDSQNFTPSHIYATPGARLLYDRKSAAYQLSISIRGLDYLIASKKLATRRLGKKIMIPHGELVRFAKGDRCKPMKGAT